MNWYTAKLVLRNIRPELLAANMALVGLLSFVVEKEETASYYSRLLAASDGESATRLARSMMEAMFPFLPTDEEVRQIAVQRLNSFVESGASFVIFDDKENRER